MNELAPRPSQPNGLPYGLVSLWDMLEFDAKEFVHALRGFKALEIVIEQQSNDENSDLVDQASAETLMTRLSDVEHACETLGAIITSDFIGDAKAKLQSGKMKWDEMAEASKLFYNVLGKELSRAKLFALSPQRAGYFDNAVDLFEMDTEISFFGARDDMDEAGKCFALGRYTACVFHLMRILERPMLALAKILLPNDPGPNWGTILKKIDAELAKKPAERIFKGEVKFFAEVAAEMRAVQHAWRNRVMHVDQIVTEERAKAIFDATISFMNAVSLKLSEDGLIDPNLSLDLEKPPQS